jgi:hypothetical protein
MGFFKELGNLTKSLSGNLDARVDQGLWFLKNGQMENAMNCFSSASLKGHPNATRLWGEMLIDQGVGHIDTLGGLMKLKKAITIGSTLAEQSYLKYRNTFQVRELFALDDESLDDYRSAVMSQPYKQIDDLDQRMLDKVIEEIKISKVII